MKRPTRPTPDDFFKQFDAGKEAKGTLSAEKVKDIAKLAVLDHTEFAKQNMRVWESIAEDATQLLVAGLIRHPTRKASHHTLIKLVVRCVSMMKLFDMIIEEEGEILDPPQSFLDGIRDDLLERIAEEKDGA